MDPAAMSNRVDPDANPEGATGEKCSPSREAAGHEIADREGTPMSGGTRVARTVVLDSKGQTVKDAEVSEHQGFPLVRAVDLDSGHIRLVPVSDVCKPWKGPKGSPWWIPVSEVTQDMASLGGAVVGEGQYLVATHTAEADTRARAWIVVSGAVAAGAGVCVFLGLSTISLEWFGAAFALPVAGLMAGILWETRCRLAAWHPLLQAGGGYRIRSGHAGPEVWCRRPSGECAWRPLSGFVVVNWGDNPGAVAREGTE
jgi:hypothetical protein